MDDKSAAEYLQEVSERGLTLEFIEQFQNADLTKFTTFTEADAEVVGEPSVHVTGTVSVEEELNTTRFGDTITINQREPYEGNESTYYNLEINSLEGNDTIIYNHTNEFYLDEQGPSMWLDVWGGPGIDSFVKTSVSYNGINVRDSELQETLTTHADYDHMFSEPVYEGGVRTGETRVVIRALDESGDLVDGWHSMVIPQGTELMKLYDEVNDLNKFIVMPEL